MKFETTTLTTFHYTHHG